MGISYGGFVALEFARQFQERLYTLTLSGIILSHEELFEMYEALSLRFYRGGPQAFELYTHYMYEKIFGERFVASVGPSLETMRRNFYERYRDRSAGPLRPAARIRRARFAHRGVPRYQDSHTHHRRRRGSRHGAEGSE